MRSGRLIKTGAGVGRLIFDEFARWAAAGRRVSLFSALAATLLCAACASRPEAGFLRPVAATAAGATAHTILVATTRKRDDRPGTFFGGERAKPLDYAKIEISVPERHKPGEIEWASEAPGNPKTDFVVRQAGYLDGEKEFVRSLNAQLAMRPRGSRKVLLFIHGYNTMFAEGLYRFAQVVHDSKSPAVPVLFTWASRGQLTQYVYDTNSATIGPRRPRAHHSSGLCERCRAGQYPGAFDGQLGHGGSAPADQDLRSACRRSSKLGSIFLAAPDIDIDVFKSQMQRFGKPRKPFYIVLSKDDQALRASSFIAGGGARLGADGNTEELAALGAVVIDLTDVKATDSSSHGKFAQLAEVAPQLASVLDKGVSAHPRPAGTAREAVSGSLEAIVSLPLTILGAPIRIIAGR